MTYVLAAIASRALPGEDAPQQAFVFVEPERRAADLASSVGPYGSLHLTAAEVAATRAREGPGAEFEIHVGAVFPAGREAGPSPEFPIGPIALIAEFGTTGADLVWAMWNMAHETKHILADARFLFKAAEIGAQVPGEERREATAAGMMEAVQPLLPETSHPAGFTAGFERIIESMRGQPTMAQCRVPQLLVVAIAVRAISSAGVRQEAWPVRSALTAPEGAQESFTGEAARPVAHVEALAVPGAFSSLLLADPDLRRLLFAVVDGRALASSSSGQVIWPADHEGTTDANLEGIRLVVVDPLRATIADGGRLRASGDTVIVSSQDDGRWLAWTASGSDPIDLSDLLAAWHAGSVIRSAAAHPRHPHVLLEATTLGGPMLVDVDTRTGNIDMPESWQAGCGLSWDGLGGGPPCPVDAPVTWDWPPSPGVGAPSCPSLSDMGTAYIWMHLDGLRVIPSVCGVASAWNDQPGNPQDWLGPLGAPALVAPRVGPPVAAGADAVAVLPDAWTLVRPGASLLLVLPGVSWAFWHGGRRELVPLDRSCDAALQPLGSRGDLLAVEVLAVEPDSGAVVLRCTAPELRAIVVAKPQEEAVVVFSGKRVDATSAAGGQATTRAAVARTRRRGYVLRPDGRYVWIPDSGILASGSTTEDSGILVDMAEGRPIEIPMGWTLPWTPIARSSPVLDGGTLLLVTDSDRPPTSQTPDAGAAGLYEVELGEWRWQARLDVVGSSGSGTDTTASPAVPACSRWFLVDRNSQCAILEFRDVSRLDVGDCGRESRAITELSSDSRWCPLAYGGPNAAEALLVRLDDGRVARLPGQAHALGNGCEVVMSTGGAAPAPGQEVMARQWLIASGILE